MKILPLLALLACGGSQTGGEQQRPAAGECRAKDAPGVHNWLDAETCKVALVPPCPAGQTFTTDPCGCYCLETP